MLPHAGGHLTYAPAHAVRNGHEAPVGVADGKARGRTRHRSGSLPAESQAAAEVADMINADRLFCAVCVHDGGYDMCSTA